MFKRLVNKILGDPNKKIIGGLQATVDEVEAFEPKYEALSDDQIREVSLELRERVQNGEYLDDILPEAYALVREASKRVTGMRHYDVQIMGGTLLHQGNVIEMRTGEGKTLVGTCPLYLNSLTGKGVHLVTVNDYLARRDGGWMGKIFNFLGLTVGCIGPEQFSGIYDPEYVNPGAELEDERLVHWRPCTRQEAYRADITYGTSSEFGFDYLRDNMVTDKSKLVQSELYAAFIDEVDNVLIDESRTPLIISGPAPRSGKEYARFADYVRRLKENTAEDDEEPNGHYDLDHKSRSVSLTEMGIAEVEKRIPDLDSDNGDSMYDPRFFHLTYYLDNAMKAQYLFHRDQQYMVANDQVVIIDDFTGRPMPSRRYSDGLHEAIEAKEGVEIKRETQTVATITLQNYFRMYEKLAGMTGTAMTDAEEFDKIYELGVFPLPTNVQYIVDTGSMGLQERNRDEDGSKGIYWVKPGSETPVFHRRTDHSDQVYGTEDAKDRAISAEIIRINETGRPVLVGTTSVEHSEIISKVLRKAGVKHQVLNAKMHQSEALTVAQAGRKGAVTISTNMAGRGTDILLGGNAEGLAAGALEDELFDRALLTQLAKTLITKGEAQAVTLAEKITKLDPSLVKGLQEVRVEFDEAAAKIEEAQLPNYLARDFHEKHTIDIAVARKMINLVRLGALNQARDVLDAADANTGLVEEAVRLNDLHSRYQVASLNEDQQAAFLAENLFEQHYAARAALIRAVMANDLKAASKVVSTVPGMDDKLVQRVQEIRAATESEREEVWRLGGLHVIGSERHESRRIDNQLRGRAARQGDPGSSRFFLSLEDELMKRFGGERLNNFMNRINIPEDMPIENGVIEKLIESSQSRLEGYNFDIRKNLVEYDDVMTKQRETTYVERREILLSENVDLDSKVKLAFDGVIDELAKNYLDDYLGFVQGEVSRVVTEYSTDATDDVNVRPILVRLRGLLPQIKELNQAELAGIKPEEMQTLLMQFAEENLEKGTNIYQLLQATRRFVPMLPPVPNVGNSLASRRSGSDRLKAKEAIRRDFMGRVESLYNDFLAEQMDASERDAVFSKAQNAINDAFVRFSVEVSIEALKTQQEKFKARVDSALSELLLDGLKKLDADQLISALDGYIQKRSDGWREALGEEEFRKFQRLLLLSAIDREWRDYLTAMDDLRREIGLEAFAQRDPKVAYKTRSFEMYQDMRNNINEYVAKNFFLQVDKAQAYNKQREAASKTAAAKTRAAGGYTVVKRERGGGTEVRRETPKLGRNDQCWCGSGKKYKACHMKSDQENGGTAPPPQNGSAPSRTNGKPKPKKKSGKARRRRR